MDRAAINQWLAGEFRAEIGRQNISRREVARRTNINHITLNRRLLGETEFTLVELIHICAALNMSAGELVARALDVMADSDETTVGT